MSYNKINNQELQKCIHQQLHSQNISLSQLNMNSNQRIAAILQQQSIETQQIMRNSNQFIFQMMQNTNINTSDANCTKANNSSYYNHLNNQRNQQQINESTSSKLNIQNTSKSIQKTMNNGRLKLHNIKLPKGIHPKQTAKKTHHSSTNMSIHGSTKHYKPCSECNVKTNRNYRVRCKDCRDIYCYKCYHNNKVRVIRMCTYCNKKKCKDCWESIWTDDKCDKCDELWCQ